MRLELRAGAPGRWATCGDRVDDPRAGDVVQLRVEGVPGCVGVLRSDTAVLGVATADADGRIRLEGLLPVGAGTFVRAEVRRPSADVPLDPTQGTPGGSMVALTNPVFF